jgi:hypothetical protein
MIFGMNVPDFFIYALCVSLAVNICLAVVVRRYFAPVTRRRACDKCGYDVRSTIDGRCPECGTNVPTRSEQPQRAITQCSFCRRSNRETGVQVEGPGSVYICAACARNANLILETHAAGRSNSTTAARSPADRSG